MNSRNNRKPRGKAGTRARVATRKEKERAAAQEDQRNLFPSPGKGVPLKLAPYYSLSAWYADNENRETIELDAC